MIRPSVAFLAISIAACGGNSATPATTPDPAAATILDARTGAPMSRETLLKRLGSADYALLGEVHDNPAHHRLRADVIAASGSRKPAIVFEQFPWGEDSVLQTRPTAPIEPWLDRAGFDRNGWRWPMHQPLIDAAVQHDLPRYGSQLNREKLRTIMRGGADAAPAPLAELMRKVPLSEAGGKALETTLAEGHCGELPAEMVPMMRNAQEVRDAAMTDAMLRASADGRPAWLIAGNGHVRRDYGVPRFLTALVPAKTSVVVGFLEREPDGALPSEAERAVYDVVWITERAEREDPCKAFRRP